MTTSNIYTCNFCRKQCKNKNSLHQHEIRCKENPNKIDTSFTMTEEQRQKGIEKRSTINLQYCKFCNKECKNKNSLQAHENRCNINPNKIDLSRTRTKNYKNFCRFCNEPHAKKKLNKHEIWCDKNPNINYVIEFYKDNHNKAPNQFTKALMLGLEKPIITQETRNKLSITSSQRTWADEEKAKHSLVMKKAVLENPESYTKSNRGRVKQIKKYGLIFDGTWELKFYEWCLNNSINVCNNIKFFPYTYNGKEHLYNPDFYLPDHDIYVEVKGYYDDKDLAKWKYFNDKLFVLLGNCIKMIDNKVFEISMITDNKTEIL